MGALGEGQRILLCITLPVALQEMVTTVLDVGSAQDEGVSEEENGTFDLWAMAAQVAGSMKQQAAEMVTTVHETNWGAELAVFGKAVQSETVELGAKTVKVLEELPDQVDTCRLECLRNLGCSMVAAV